VKLSKLNGGPEIFHTIQGEGISTGAPAVFIRASRCNLHCHWCDTDHTWNFEGTPWAHEKDSIPGYRKHVKEEVTFEIEPVEAAERILAYNCDRTVITGGEPLLQQEDFLKIISHIRNEDPLHQFEVETNGTRVPTPEFAAAVNQFNISPKLGNAGMLEKTRINPAALSFFTQHSNAWFKFVVAGPVDVEEIELYIREYSLPRKRILLMPEGRTSEELDRTSEWLANICRDRNFRFCDRLHVRIWGDKRGV
jgi:7-carboxy-7-deazaguanine synthase